MKKWKILFISATNIFTLFLSAYLQAEIHSPRPEISIQSLVEVTAGQEIKLMDIGTVGFVKPKEAATALSMKIMPALSEGETKKIKNSELIKILKMKVAENSDISELKWTYFASDEITMIAKKNILSNLSIQNQVELYLRSKCADCKIALKDLKIPTIREKNLIENCEVQLESMKMGGSFLIPVQCQVATEKRTYWVSGVAKISKLAPVANRQLNPGEKISSHDFRMEDVDLTYAKDGVPSFEEVTGQMVGRMILLNQTIFKSDFKKELAISRGQIIKAISGNEVFEVTSQAVAEEQGYIGDLIRIKNTESQKTLSGQIVEKGVVRVQ